MWQSPELKEHLDTSSVINGESAVYMEWNLNDPENIDRVGNYRLRHGTTGISATAFDMFDPFDAVGAYTDATNADIVIEGEYDNNGDPTIFTTVDEKMKTQFSLDDCFTSNRPRSGINKILMLPGSRWLPANNYVDGRPRYYPGSKSDPFKYWTSYRTISPEKEPNAANRYPGGIPGTMEVGISKPGGIKFIDDACPFVVYTNTVYANRITIKMQTHAASVQGADVIVNGVNIGDPLFGYENQQTPSIWKVQALKNNAWVDIYSVSESLLRSDGSPIIGTDGHVELAYGLRVPKGYNYQGRVTAQSKLPSNPFDYDAYLVADGTSVGFLYKYNDGWTLEPAIYDWHLVEDEVATLPIDDINAMETYNNGFGDRYRDVDDIKGLRIVVTAMNTANSTFDLIEMSPRLLADVTSMVTSYSSKAAASSMSDSSLPVGYLLPGTGSVEMIDTESVFNDPNSIFSGLNTLNIKFLFYEKIRGVDGVDYSVPIRTMYTEGNQPNMDDPPTIKWELRDGYWLLEKTKAPSLFMRNVSMSVAVATMLDYIGFSNYTFKRIDKEEFTIPYFYTSDEKTVAEVLQDLARAAQYAMFFDEYNNLVIMSKEYFLSASRAVDTTLSGNSNTPHIISLASTEKKRYNDGRIDYSERYIQRSIASLQQANFVNQDQTLVYKPVLLWEASGTELVRANNEMGQTQSAFSLGACALNVSLDDQIPYVENGAVKNNVIDLGESVYWLPRYNGYFYANGEIIKFDAVEYSVYSTTFDNDNELRETLVKTAWVSSNAEYQKYFADVPFNGKMYPTGRVRIFTEPEYGTDVNGNTVIVGIRKHGRAQFQTPITSHSAGIDSSWTLPASRFTIVQDADYLFKDKDNSGTFYDAASGKSKAAKNASATVNGIIKNFFRNVTYTEAQITSFITAQAGTLQASALVLKGFKDDAKDDVSNLTVVKKELPAPPNYVAARVRIIGEVKAAGDVEQTALGENTYYTGLNGARVLTGGSAGIAINLNPDKNTGYFFELIALSNTTLGSDAADTDAHNVIFYKNVSPNNGTDANAKSVPLKLWGGRANVVVDSGEFVGLGRQTGEEIPNVYDIAIEYKQFENAIRFYLYINGQQVAVVDDMNEVALGKTNTYGLFCRGTSKVMFENTTAMTGFTASNTLISNSAASAFGDDNINVNDAMRKFSLSGVLQRAYLDGIGTSTAPDVTLFYDEFGTIMRECAYFNVKFDKAYPAMRARMSPTFNNTQGYFVSGFTHHAYGAEFLIFNATDKALNLDETSGNYLRIQGVTFTQSNQRTLTVDDYYNEVGSTSDVYTANMNLLRDPLLAQEAFRDVRIDRRKRGKQEFSLQTEYIQRQDDAENMMGWLTAELTKQRMLLGIDVFPYPIIQLGDVVEVDYTDSNGVEFAGGKRFVVYNVEYDKSEEGLSQKVYLAEVLL